MALSDLETLINASAQNTSQFKGLSAAYEFLGFGVPTIDGYTFLINENNSTNFGAGPGVTFNDENIYINTMNALYQGNPSAKAVFDALVGGGATLQDKLTIVYNTIVPASEQTGAGRDYFVSQAAFYTARAAELGIPGLDGATLVGAASLMKIVVDQDVPGVGDSINDLFAAVNNGSAVIPQSGAAFTPIEIADGTNFDGDDVNPSAGQTFTLTGNADAIPGLIGSSGTTANFGDDIVLATQATLGSGDVLDGGDGFDTLLYASSGVGPVSSAGFSTNSIEEFHITSDATNTGTTFDVSGVVGAGVLINENSSSDLNLVGLQNLIDIEVRDTSTLGPGAVTVDTNITYTAAAVTGANDVQNLTLANVFDPVAGLGVTNTAVRITGNVETVAITTEGTGGSHLSLLDTGNLRTVTVAGAQNLTLDSVGFDGASNVLNAGAFTGDLDVTLNTSGVNDVAVTGGAGDDRADFSAGFDAGDSFTGGAGVDTLALINATATLPVLGGTVSGVEILEVTDAAAGVIDADNFVGIGTYNFDVGLGGAVLVDDAVSGITVNANALNGNNLDVDLKTDGPADVVTINFDTAGGATVTADDAETLNLDAGGLFTLSAADATTIVFAGDNNFNVFGAAATTNPSTVDASAYTGDATFTLFDLAAAGADVLLGSGDDTFNVATANGADVFDISAGGDDTIVYTAVVQSDDDADHIVGFEAGDGNDIADVTGLMAGGATTSDQFLGTRATFALAQGALVGFDGINQAVYQQDDNILWVDSDDNGVLNDFDFRVFLDGVNGSNLTAFNLGIPLPVTFTANKAGFSTFVAADSVENVVTGPNGDTINATVAQLAGATVDGLLGNDTFNISGPGVANLQGFPGAFINNVEIINAGAGVTGLQINSADLVNDSLGGGDIQEINGTALALDVDFNSFFEVDFTGVALDGISSITVTNTANTNVLFDAGSFVAPIILGGGNDNLLLSGPGGSSFDFTGVNIAGFDEIIFDNVPFFQPPWGTVTFNAVDLFGITAITDNGGSANATIEVLGNFDGTTTVVADAAVQTLDVTGNMTLNAATGDGAIFENIIGGGASTITLNAAGSTFFNELSGIALINATALLDNETLTLDDDTTDAPYTINVTSADVNFAASFTDDNVTVNTSGAAIANQLINLDSTALRVSNDTVNINNVAAHTITTGDGDDAVNFNVLSLDVTDSVDGGAGTDTLFFLDAGATNDLNGVLNFETITAGDLATSVTTVDGLIAPGQSLVFNGPATSALTLDLSAETNGSITVNVGSGGSAIIMTSNNLIDTYNLGSGADALTLDTNNTIANLANVDVVDDFLAGGADTLNVTNANGAAEEVYNVTLDATTTVANFLGNLNTALFGVVGYPAASATAGDVIVVTVTGGALAGTYAVSDTTAAAGLDGTAEIVELTGVIGAITGAEFV